MRKTGFSQKACGISQHGDYKVRWLREVQARWSRSGAFPYNYGRRQIESTIVSLPLLEGIALQLLRTFRKG